MGYQKSSPRRAIQFLKLRPYKVTVIHSLQPHDPFIRVNFSSWFLRSVGEGEIDPQPRLFYNEAWFQLEGYTNAQMCYWSSQNWHLTHKVPLHPVKICVWCAVSARSIVRLPFYNETGISRAILSRADSVAGFSKTQLLLTLHLYPSRLCLMPSEQWY
jgi:hypothetical protein